MSELRIYCWGHKDVHDLTPGQAERVIYLLTVALSDAWTEPEEDRLNAGRPAEEHLECPLDVLRWNDPEMYAEWVEQGVECRQAVAGESGWIDETTEVLRRTRDNLAMLITGSADPGVEALGALDEASRLIERRLEQVGQG